MVDGLGVGEVWKNNGSSFKGACRGFTNFYRLLKGLIIYQNERVREKEWGCKNIYKAIVKSQMKTAEKEGKYFTANRRFHWNRKFPGWGERYDTKSHFFLLLHSTHLIIIITCNMNIYLHRYFHETVEKEKARFFWRMESLRRWYALQLGFLSWFCTTFTVEECLIDSWLRELVQVLIKFSMHFYQ